MKTRTRRPNSKAETFWIILAKTVQDLEVDPTKPRRVDLGERPVFRPVLVSSAMVWLRSGTEKDIVKARDYAAQEGYKVFTFPRAEKDPLGKAKAAVLARKHNPAAPSLLRTRPHKDFMGQGILYLVSTSRGNVYFMRYNALRSIAEGGPRDRGVIGRFMSMSPSGDLTNQDVPPKVTREIEDVLLENRVDLSTPPN